MNSIAQYKAEARKARTRESMERVSGSDRSALTLALLYSFELIRLGHEMDDTEDIRNALKERLSVTLDYASPSSIWSFFTDENGTGLRVHMAYPDSLAGFMFGLPVVSQLEAIPNLIRYYENAF